MIPALWCVVSRCYGNTGRAADTNTVRRKAWVSHISHHTLLALERPAWRHSPCVGKLMFNYAYDALLLKKASLPIRLGVPQLPIKVVGK